MGGFEGSSAQKRGEGGAGGKSHCASPRGCQVNGLTVVCVFLLSMNYHYAEVLFLTLVLKCAFAKSGMVQASACSCRTRELAVIWGRLPLAWLQGRLGEARPGLHPALLGWRQC